MNALPETVGLDTLADLIGVSDRRVRQLADGGVIPAGKKGQWPLVETLKKLFTHYRDASGDNTEEMAREKLRKMTGDADTSQMEAAKTAERIMFCEDAEALWGDRIVITREHIQRAHYIPEPDRKRLLEELAALKFEDA